jgi:hypothetical protein
MEKNLGLTILEISRSQYLEILVQAAANSDLANYQQILHLMVDDLWMDPESIAYFTKKPCSGPCNKDGVVQRLHTCHCPTSTPYFLNFTNTLENMSSGEWSF